MLILSFLLLVCILSVDELVFQKAKRIERYLHVLSKQCCFYDIVRLHNNTNNDGAI